MLLGEVADLQAVPGHEIAGVGLLGAGQQSKQGRLARAVETQHDHPRSSVDGEIHTGEHLQRPVILGQPACRQRGPAARGRLRKLDPGNLVGDPVRVQCGHHAVGAAQHVLRRNGFGGFGAQLGSLGAQCGRLALGVRPLPTPPLLVGGPGIEVLLPTHVVDVGLAAHGVEKPHPVDDLGEQLHIVADDHQSPGVGLQEVSKPADGIGVEMVGGLVEQQGGCRTGTGFAGGEEDPRQFHPATLTAGQCSQGLREHPIGQSQTGTDPTRLAFRGITSQRGEALLKLTVMPDCPVAVGVIDHLGHQ